MSVKVRLWLTCDEPGCIAYVEALARVRTGGLGTLSLKAPEVASWQAWEVPSNGDPVDTPTYCPKHRKKQT